MARKFLEMAEDSRGIGGEDVARKAADGLIGFQKFGMVVCDGIFVHGHDAVIAAGERAGPSIVRPEFFVVLENLARQREQGVESFALREAGGFEHLHAGLFDGEDESGGECARCVIEGFLFGSDVHRDTAEGTGDGARNANGGGVAFDGKDFSFERRDADAIEGLQRVHGSGERAARAHRLQGASVARATGVQNDFSAELMSADASEFGGNFGDGVIGYAYKNDFSGESVVRDAREWLTGSDEFCGFACRSLGMRGDDKNAPAAFMQEAAQSASHAPGTENGQGLQHPC